MSTYPDDQSAIIFYKEGEKFYPSHRINDKGDEIGRTLALGIYDPEGRCQQMSPIGIEHLFISWASYRPGELLRQLKAIQAKGRRPLVTIEPWPDRTITWIPSALLGNVTKGKYDRRIQQLATEIAAFRGLVLVRWGHEMENVTGRYPWAIHNAGLYREAYRHFVTACRLSASNIVYLWSPLGDRGLGSYWPGPEYVDCVGLSLFEFPAFDRDHYHRATRTFRDQMTEKYGRVAKYQKPIVISECGVTGTKEYQLGWLSGALQDAGNYPLLKALIYFNAIDTPGVWGKKYATPDWRINGSGFLEVIRASL